MKDVTYTGTSDVYIIGSESWTNLGISSKETAWKQGETLSVADKAADWLVANHPHEFEVKGANPDPETLQAAEADAARGTGGEGGGLSGPAGASSIGTTGGGTTSGGTTGTGTASSSTGR